MPQSQNTLERPYISLGICRLLHEFLLLSEMDSEESPYWLCFMIHCTLGGQRPNIFR